MAYDTLATHRSDLCAHRQFGRRDSDIFAGQIELARNKAIKIRPRHIDVLRKMDWRELPLVRHPEDGKYRIGGVHRRTYTVIPRTIDDLLHWNAVRPVGDRLVMTDKGRRLLRRFSCRVVDVKLRRMMDMGIKKYVKMVPQEVQVVIYDGQNYKDVHELTEGKDVVFTYNPAEGRMNALVGGVDLTPNERVLVRDASGAISLLKHSEFMKECKEVR